MWKSCYTLCSFLSADDYEEYEGPHCPKRRCKRQSLVSPQGLQLVQCLCLNVFKVVEKTKEQLQSVAHCHGTLNTSPTHNREEGRQMVTQQVQNILYHLKEVHGVEKHQVTVALLPKKTPPFPGRKMHVFFLACFTWYV